MRTLYQELLIFALGLADTAAGQIMPHYLNCAVNTKSDGSVVTEADRRAEEIVREIITKRFPEHGILGEEYGVRETPDSKYQWVIDPLDGTTWFTLGVPNFGTLIALLEDGEPIIGVIHFPVTDETVYAGKGLGCWFKGSNSTPVQVQVGESVKLEEAVVSAAGVHSSDIHTSNGEVPFNLSAVIHKSRKFRFCGDCLQHALVSRGRIHAAIDTLMQPWDIAAIIPCIEEAGGIATTLSGERKGIVFGGNLLTSCHPSLHQEILDALNSNAA